MERPSKIQQLYAYSVCLTAVITVLITLPGMLDAFAQRRAPLQTPQFGGESGVMAETFEQHKIANPGYQYLQRPGTFGERTVYDTLTESQARERYELKRAERIASVGYQTSRELTKDLVLLLASVALFVGHWRWLRLLARTGSASTS